MFEINITRLQIVFMLVGYYFAISIEYQSNYRIRKSYARSILEKPIQHNAFYRDTSILPQPTKFLKRDSAYWTSHIPKNSDKSSDSRNCPALGQSGAVDSVLQAQ